MEDFKVIESNALPVYDDRYIRTKVREYDDKVCNNFSGSNVPEDDAECESFTVISIVLYLFTKTNITCKSD